MLAGSNANKGGAHINKIKKRNINIASLKFIQSDCNPQKFNSKSNCEFKKTTKTTYKHYSFKGSTLLNLKNNMTIHEKILPKNKPMTIKKDPKGKSTGFELLARTMIAFRPTKKKTIKTPSIHAMKNK